MSKKNTGGPALPGFDYVTKDEKRNPDGMALRDYFAAKAMASLILQLPKQVEGTVTQVLIASVSYQVADKMLAERSK